MPDETFPIADVLTVRDARIRALEVESERLGGEVESLWGVIHSWAGVLADLVAAQ